MARTITSGLRTALQSGTHEFRFLIELRFQDIATPNDNILRIWNDTYDVSWDGKTWNGAGRVQDISPFELHADNSATPWSIVLSGVDPARVSEMLRGLAGRPIKYYVAILDRGTGLLLPDPVFVVQRQMWSGPYNRFTKTWVINSFAKFVQQRRGGHRVRAYQDQLEYAATLGENNDECLYDVTGLAVESTFWPGPRYEPKGLYK